MIKTQIKRVFLFTVLIFMTGLGRGQILAHIEIPEPPGIEIIEKTVKIIDKAVGMIEKTLGRGRTLSELVDYYRSEMTYRGWVLKELEIEEKEAEMKFTKGKAKAEIEIEAKKGGFKVRIKSSDKD